MTITQIADSCGVSKKTVSRVINGEANVSPETRERVLAAIKKNKYRPNVFARNLGRKRFTTILVTVRRTSTFRNTIWIDQLLMKVIDRAQEAGCRILMEIYTGTFDREHTAMIDGGLVDAIVVFYEEENDPRLRLASEFGIPAIAFGRSTSDVPTVSNEDFGAMTSAYSHLFSRELYKSTLLLGDRFVSNEDRYRGACRAYEESGIDPALLAVHWGVNSAAQVKSIVDEAIDRNNLPDVFFVSGDEKALGAYSALLGRGYRIPEDVSIVGFDDISISEHLVPSLTTVRQDFTALADALVASALRLINGDETVENIAVPTELVVRDSTR